MTAAACVCGFTEAGDETVADHLRAMFTPDDDEGIDGRVHLEGETSLFCMCGAGGSASELDAHFLAVFTHTDLIGRDGERHEPFSSLVTCE